METQYISLNMTPTGVNPCFHISQYDVGRMLGFIVHSGGATVDLDTYTCTVEATRSDGTAITSAVATTDNIGTFEVTPTMSNKADKYRCQLVIVDENSKRIASLPFSMEVTKAAMDENSEAIEEDASLYQQYTEAVQGAIAEANADIQAEENARIAAVSAEATARQNADATLQNNIDAEVTARQTDDNTLQGNINSEASTRATQDASLQSQINQIIAPSGEAPSAAEVQNARVGADGVTYSTLGDAIRTNDNNIKNALNTVCQANGIVIPSSGTYYVPFAAKSGDVIKIINGSSGINVWGVNSNGQNVDEKWVSANTTVTLTLSADIVRFKIYTSAASSAMFVNTSTGILPDYLETVDFLKAFSVRSIARVTSSNYSTVLPSCDNAEKDSIYLLVFSASSPSPINNYPGTPEGSSEWLFTFGVSGNDIKKQILIKNKNTILTRHYSGSWTDWETISINNCVKGIKQISSTNYSTDLPSLDNAEKNSIYILVFGSSNPIANYPGVPEGSLEFLFTFGVPGSNFKTQILFKSEWQILKRKYTSSWTDWQIISKPREIHIGPGQEFTTLKAGIEKAIKYKGTKVIVHPKADNTPYDLTSEFAAEIAADQTDVKFGNKLENDVHIIFETGAKVTALCTNVSANITTCFNPFYAGTDGGGYTLENLDIDASNTRYCLHDEAAAATTPRTVKILNCKMVFDNRTAATDWYGQCLGGGLGINDYIEIRGCYFDSKRRSQPSSTAGEIASYHNNGFSSHAVSRIVVSDCYFAGKGTFKFSYWGTTEEISEGIINNCSLGSEIIVRQEQSQNQSPENIDVLEFNNVVRN